MAAAAAHDVFFNIADTPKISNPHKGERFEIADQGIFVECSDDRIETLPRLFIGPCDIIFDDVGVVAHAAHHEISTAAYDGIVAEAAQNTVGTAAAVYGICAIGTEERVLSAIAAQDIVAVAARQCIVSIAD